MIHEDHWYVSIVKDSRLQIGSNSWFTHTNYTDIIKRK